jgi:DNA-3-methyladenine glycosylase II
MTAPLTRARFDEAVGHLADRDADLAAVVEAFGAPVWRRRPQGFRTLLYLILEQQVSLASARATFDRLAARLGAEPEPRGFLALGDDDLRAVGLSRQKARYGRALAEAVLDGRLRLDRLGRHDDETVRVALMRLPGIGPWTADIYLMEALGRPDVWPVGDLALAVGAEKVKRLDARPDQAALADLGEAWRPWRAVAARIVWHYYLTTVRTRGGGIPV